MPNTVPLENFSTVPVSSMQTETELVWGNEFEKLHEKYIDVDIWKDDFKNESKTSLFYWEDISLKDNEL